MLKTTASTLRGDGTRCRGRTGRRAKASKLPVGTDRVHEIKHDGYQIIVRRDGPIVRSTAAMQMTGPLDSVRSRTVQDQAKSFTIGEAVVLGPDGLSRSRS
jgi:bifunctional non-homologous end joining protein LigD